MFPESFYPPIKNSREYITTVYNGLDLSKDVRILFCGLIKNNTNYAVYNISQLLNNFPKSEVVIYENDTEYHNVYIHNRVHYIHEILNHDVLEQDKSILRKQRMALYRNKVLQYAKSLNNIYDYIAVVDFDLIGGYSIEGIYNTLSLMNSFSDKFIFGSNGIYYQDNRRLYYDSWAYRDISSWRERSDEENNVMTFERGEDPIEVNSCFGGLCFYPASILSTDFEYKAYDCDHVTLNYQLKSLGYRIWLNPNQITLYSPHYYRL